MRNKDPLVTKLQKAIIKKYPMLTPQDFAIFQKMLEETFDRKFDQKFDEKFDKKFDERFDEKFEEIRVWVSSEILTFKDSILSELVPIRLHCDLQSGRLATLGDKVDKHEKILIEHEKKYANYDRYHRDHAK